MLNNDEQLEKINANFKELELVLEALLKNNKKLNLKEKALLNKNLDKQKSIEIKLDKLGM